MDSVHTEMTVRSRSAVDWLLEAELLDDDTRAKIKVGTDDVDNLLVGLLASTVGIDKDGEWLGNTDSIRELDECTTSETSVDQRLGYERLVNRQKSIY
jgi:hypothetical protein